MTAKQYSSLTAGIKSPGQQRNILFPLQVIDWQQLEVLPESLLDLLAESVQVSSAYRTIPFPLLCPALCLSQAAAELGTPCSVHAKISIPATNISNLHLKKYLKYLFIILKNI